MQSHDGYIRLLPALPDEWKTGEFRGVCARGGFELDMSWREGEITTVKVHSKMGEVCRIGVGRSVSVSCEGRSVESKELADGVVEFPTTQGATYLLQVR